MKLLKVTLFSITSLLAFLTIIFSTGASICKFADVHPDSIIQIFGYLSFFWVLILSGLVFVLFLLVRKFRVALFYMAAMVIFTFLLNDFSLKYLNYKIPANTSNYDTLKVAAYNVKYYSYGIENIANYIKESDIDVVLFSESVLTPEKMDILKNNIPAYSVYSDSGRDLSILSRYPVVNYEIIDLPTYLASFSSSNDIEKLKETGIHRSFVHAVVNINGTDVNFLSLRLIAGRAKDRSMAESIKWGKYLMYAQNQELSVFLSYLVSLKGPVIFGGDLNSPPNSGIIHQIKKHVSDSYLDKHSYGKFTFKASFPTVRLDFIFHSGDVIVKNSKVVNPLLSDHFMVRSEFLIPKKTN
jgi:endonuclease/exonuclease/phosphatase (EEP) superfamily protein YafD